MTERAVEERPRSERRGLGRRMLGNVRTRIIASYVLMLAISGMATTLIVREVLLVELNDQVDADLAQEAGEFRQLAGGIDPRSSEPFGTDVQRIFEVFLSRNVPSEGEQLITVEAGGPTRFRGSAQAQHHPPDELTSQWINADGPARGEVETQYGPVRYLAIPVMRDERVIGTFAVANYLAGERDEVDEAVTIIATVAAIILLGGTAAAFLVAGRVVAPLREFRDAARSVSGSDMTKRIAVRGDDELAELGRTFNRMLDRIEIAFGTQSRFIREAGHELRTPIAIVRGHLELLAEEESDPGSQRRETFEMLNGELDRMTRFVNDMLTLAKAERPDFLQLETVHLGRLCEELLHKASALGERQWSIDSRADASVVADRQRLTQAVINLAGNSVSSSLAGEAISIGSRIEGSTALLWVSDSGRGIDPSEHEIVLEPFRRGRGARYEGSGLGLPIVAAIAAAHGGSMEIESEPDRGTTVTLRLPVDGPEIQPEDKELR